jgi:hypothetical protein
MKSTPGQYLGGHRVMHRAIIKYLKGDKQTWSAISWQNCPKSKMVPAGQVRSYESRL